MDWNAVGAIGEIVGAVAVVATLAYLAQQIRDQNRANQTAAFEGIVDAFSQFNMMLAADTELHRIYTTGLNDPTELTDDEAGRFSWLFRAYMNNNHKIYRAYQRGSIEEKVWSQYAAEAAEQLETPGGRQFIEQSASWDYVNALREHRSEESVVNLSLGRTNLKR